MRPIYVVNNFGQFNHLILRMLRDLGIEARMVPNTTPPDEVAAESRGVVLGGGPSIERVGRAPEYLDLDLPVLGICLGLHVIARRFGGTVAPGRLGGYGAVEVEIRDHDRILRGYPDRVAVWASHQDEVAAMPENFDLLATSTICPAEAIAHRYRPIFGIQWHPEVSHTFEGRRVYENFDAVCRGEA
jgi:GMP synthase (glutamine-hydrolysing)